VQVENFHLFQSLHHYQRNSEFWRNLFSALCHIVYAYYTRIKSTHKFGYLYIYWRVILCGSLRGGTGFVWAKGNVGVCLVVFLVRVVAL
jgi:hypothetical protein